MPLKKASGKATYGKGLPSSPTVKKASGKATYGKGLPSRGMAKGGKVSRSGKITQGK